MSDVLVVFHSRTGYCRMLAESLAKKRGWALGEVGYLDGRQSLARCTRDALLQRMPEIRYEGPDPDRFRAVVLVAPVWCLQLCPLMRSFARSLRDRPGEVALLTCIEVGGAENALAEVERLVGRRVAASLALRQTEVEAGSRASALRAFADEVAAGARPRRTPALQPA